MKLSSRENDIMKLMRAGFKNKEIAINLSVNQKTISTYVKRIKMK